MPGLVGAICLHKDTYVDLELFRKISKSIVHRDWYKTETYTDKSGKVAAGRVHLGILDSRRQPYVSTDGLMKIFLYGEIYNDDIHDGNQLDYIFREYESAGIEFAKKLNGSFLILIIDEMRDRIVIANDRTASRPFFYFTDGETFYFAPELKTLLLIPSLRKAIHPLAVISFLAAGYFLKGLTLIEDVKLLDNAMIVRIENSQVSMWKYWDYGFDESVKDRGFKYYRSTLAELLRLAVSRRVRTNHRYGILLSGGYDSRGILGCYLENRKQNPDNAFLKTISWGSSQDVPYSDCAIAQRLANKFGINHNFFKLRPEYLPQHLHDFIYLHDGLTDGCKNYPESLAIFRQIREELGVQVLLRGDECFGWINTAINEKSMFESLGIHTVSALKRYRYFLTDEFDQFMYMMNSLLSDISARCQSTKIHDRKDFFYLDQRLKYYLNHLNYVKNIEIEIRTPYIDNDILDFMSELPSKYRLAKNLYRNTIKSMFPEFFDDLACYGDEIDWRIQIKNHDFLYKYIREEMLKESIAFRELVNFHKIDTLLGELVKSHSQNRLKSIAVSLVGSCPSIYEMFKQKYKLLQKNLSVEQNMISKESIMFRLLTLKTWDSMFFT